MNSKIIAIVSITVLIMGMVAVNAANAQTIKQVVARSMFADKKAFNEGDIITVHIVEFTRGASLTDTRTNSDNRTNANAATSGAIGLPAFGLDSQLNNRHEAKGETRSQGTLESKMTAIVTEVQDNGLLSIEGTRVVNVNGEKQTTILTGFVRPEDVQSDNTVLSYHIANAQITYKGKGAVTEAGKPGIIARIWNWIF